MADLRSKLFKGELSEEEWGELLKRSRALDEYSDPLVEEALARYKAFGLPKPPQGGGLSGAAKLWVGLGIGTAALAGAWMASRPKEVPLPQAEAQVPLAVAPAAPPRRVSLPPKPRPPAPAKPAAVPEEVGNELGVKLDLDSTELVEVEIQDLAGKRLKRLYSGLLKPGSWNFDWDGSLENGKKAGPGPYDIVVKAKGLNNRRRIEIR